MDFRTCGTRIQRRHTRTKNGGIKAKMGLISDLDYWFEENKEFLDDPEEVQDALDIILGNMDMVGE